MRASGKAGLPAARADIRRHSHGHPIEKHPHAGVLLRAGARHAIIYEQGG